MSVITIPAPVVASRQHVHSEQNANATRNPQLYTTHTPDHRLSSEVNVKAKGKTKAGTHIQFIGSTPAGMLDLYAMGLGAPNTPLCKKDKEGKRIPGEYIKHGDMPAGMDIKKFRKQYKAKAKNFEMAKNLSIRVVASNDTKASYIRDHEIKNRKG